MTAQASGKTIGVIQSNYIPWKGYFDIIGSVDEFLIYDCAQYTVRDWRNRNRIKTHKGLQWLTIPVLRKGHLKMRISEMTVSGGAWRHAHWRSIVQNYARSPYFETYSPPFEEYYLRNDERNLSRINVQLIRIICELLGIKTLISIIENLPPGADKTDRLIAICEQAGASRLLFGPAVAGYLDTDRFRGHGLEDLWMDYGGYPEYRQNFPPFQHHVTVLDLLFNEGPRSRQFMKCLRIEDRARNGQDR